MTKNTKIIWLSAMGILVAGALLMFVRDWRIRGGTAACGDPEGPRPSIDLRRFETDYTGYSVSLEAELAGKGKLAGKFEPAALQTLSESIQTGQEFRKGLIAGYNACAVTRRSYQSAILRFQSLDGIARRIDTLAGKSSLSDEERNTLTRLVEEYSNMAQKLGDGQN